MTENEEEPRQDADRSRALERSSDRTEASGDEARPDAAADDPRQARDETTGEDDAHAPGDGGDAEADIDPDETFDRDGLVVIAAIFSLIGLAMAVEFFWR